MHRSYPPSPRLPSARANDESSLDDYEEAFLDVEDGEVEFVKEHILSHFEPPPRGLNNESRTSSVTTPDWEDPESWMANSESFPISTPGSSNGASPLLTGTSSQGVSPKVNPNFEAFPFSIPEDPNQSLSSISDVLQVEKDFMEYVMSFPLGTSPSVPSHLLPARKNQNDSNNPKIGLDHLDNLCKLMEQLSDLKEANIKLKRRVQYLEDIKTLHEIHKEMVGENKIYSSGLSEEEVLQLKEKYNEAGEDIEVSDEDQTFLENPCQGLYRSKTTNQIGPNGDYKGHKSRSATVNKERRERSKSVGHPGSHPKSKKRPSRWSKVKEVLGIEKAEEVSTTCEAEKSDSHGNDDQKEQERLNRKDSERSKGFKLSSSRSHSNVLSSRSFSEAERQSTTPIVVKKSGTLDLKTAQSGLERYENEEIGAKKSPKTPWGKMKTMIQIRRDHRHNQKSESSSSSPRDAKANKSPSVSSEAINGHTAVSRRSQRSNHRSSFQDGTNVQSSDYNAQNGSMADERNSRHQRLDAPEQQFRHRQKQSPQKHSHKKTSVSHQDTECQHSKKGESSPQKHRPENSNDKDNGEKETNGKETSKRKKSKPRPPPLDYVGDQQNAIPYGEDADRVLAGVSPQTQRKWMWTKVKDALKGKKEDDGVVPSMSAPSSPGLPAACLAFDFDEDKVKTEEVVQNDYDTSHPAMLPCTPSATVSDLLRELQQNLSDDFNKKLEEWQRCRAEAINKGVAVNPEVERKDSFGRIRKISKTDKKLPAAEKLAKSTYHIPKKDLSWLEKEQQKVDREIIRLTKEKQKFEKRASRLKQLRESMTEGDGQKKEVLVKTSAGEFRFEGISDAFTKKLYEWETKKGVNPELSTIALLDESLKPAMESVVSIPSVGSNSIRPSPEPAKSCYQVSRASSEPDLSFTLKENNSNNQAIRSKSGDTLLSADKDSATALAEDNCDSKQDSRDTIPHADDNYYSLLEENMYLLDQLKEKEEMCFHLQNELDRLDDRTEKNNRTHQEEMEKYRQKLWEIHMSRPRDLQGSLHLISELKSRIDELQKCSDELKLDRERLEESFRYHSSQQARLTDDLIRKIRELQDSGVPSNFTRGNHRRKWRKFLKCDPSSISRIHDLSTTLLQQARDVEQTLMERTRQVCHLRWELLHRDMSAVLLQAALHRVTSQGEPVTILPTWDKRRTRFKNLKAWSVDTTTRRPSQDLVSDDWLQERLRQLSMTPYNDWTNIDVSPSDLITTAHDLKRETLRLSISRPDPVSDSEEKKSATYSADSEVADSDRYYDTGSAVNSRSSSFSSGGCGGLRGSHSDTRLYERGRSAGRFFRRNSSSSMSCVEASDSSSMQDSEHQQCLVRRFPFRQKWRSLDNVSSSCSSRSSVLDEDVGKAHWRSAKPGSRVQQRTFDEDPHTLQQIYGSFKEADEESEDSRVKSLTDWGSQCLITPRPMHLSRISDTDSEKNSRSSSLRFGKLKSVEYHPLQASTSFQGAKSQSLYAQCNSTLNSNQLEANHQSGHDDDNHNVSYKSATDGSIESLDKYETAIRDEELTFSDEKYATQCSTDRFETFSVYEDEQKRTAASCQLSGAEESFSCFDRGVNFSSKDNHTLARTSISGRNTPYEPGSPDIRKFKYKGTKGFGRSRVGYGQAVENEGLTFKSIQGLSSCRSSEDTSRLDS